MNFKKLPTEPISTELGTKRLWGKGVLVSSNEGFRLFLRGDNYKIAKMHERNLKKTSSPVQLS